MISLYEITKRHGPKILFEKASLQINAGEKIGLVGANGGGKTTLFRILVGEEGVESGGIEVPKKAVIAYFSQDVGEMAGRSALAEVIASAGQLSTMALEIQDLEKRLEDSATNPLSDEAMTELLERYGEVQNHYQQLGGYDLDSRAKAILTGLGIGPGDYDLPVESFSGGWKMRIALAKVLVKNPNVLLMDEPTNHLDVESIVWLEEWIKSFKGCLLMTSHDREFMNSIVSRIVEVGGKSITSYSGNYDFYERERAIRREQLVASARKQDDMLAKEEEFIARFAARASHAAQVQSRVKKLDKIERIEVPADEKVMKLLFAAAPRTGNDVVVMKDLAKSWIKVDGSEKPVFSGVTGTIRRMEKTAVVGVNGAGKSTLLKVITGQTEASSGIVNLGSNVKLGYFSQHSLDVLNPQNTIYEEVASRVPEGTISFIKSLLGAFLFSGDDVNKKISVLSGGEKSRVVLASILANPVNFLVLDEPTNHLDLKSREVLLASLQDFEGTLMIVSHDRYFLKHLVNRVLEVDHGALHSYDGTYDEYLARRPLNRG